MPSLISVNMAVSVAVEQERRRQDGRAAAAAAAGLEAACVSLCPCEAIFRLTHTPHFCVGALYTLQMTSICVLMLLKKSAHNISGDKHNASIAVVTNYTVCGNILCINHNHNQEIMNTT